MNRIILDGIIQDIKDAHTIGDIQYKKANLIVRNSNSKYSIINLQFKKFQCEVEDGQQIQIVGNIRSHSTKVSPDKNHVNIYVFTYFDEPYDEEKQLKNQFLVDGRICKIEPVRILENDKTNIHFILANNIITQNSKLNSYLPCIAWGKCANRLSKLNKNDNIVVQGELRSREYKKPLENGQFEFRVAHELLVTDFMMLDQYENNL